MASEVKTNKVSPSTGTTLSVGDSGDTLALAVDSVTGFNVGSDAAGDVLYHDGTDYTRLAKPGTPADEVLTFATSATAPSWAAAAGGGKVLQVISNTWSSASSTTSTTYALVTDSGTSITPAATSSKIWISGNVSVDTVGSDQGRIKLYNGASEITAASGTVGSATNPMVAANGMNYAVAGITSLAYSFLLSPSTTSAVTINLYHAVSGGTGYINRNHGNTTEGFSSSMTLMEIGS
jgi:hypothetical protein